MNAWPTTVLPFSLCKAFSHTRAFGIVGNEYKNGESQRTRLTLTSRKSWRISNRLSPSALQTLREFWDARKGSQEPFWFYDVWETYPKFSYDATGFQTTGRYTVRFEGAWSQTVGIGRSETEISLIELA